MNDDMPVVCMSWTCVYKETCLRWIENIIIGDGDEAGYSAEWYVNKVDDCYLPVDGQTL